jgi:hypothetical protein
MFGGTPGPLRLLNSALGGQAGWLLGFAILSGLGILVATRLRRADARTGSLIAVGGAFVTTAVLFSSASGIFHPYYVSLLAPFIAALVGAGAAQMLRGGLNARILAPVAIAAGVAGELVVRSRYPGQLDWLPAVLIVVGALAALALMAFSSTRVRMVALGAAVTALLLAPSVWAVDTLGYATSSTFPSGGPASALSAGGGAGFGGGAGRRRLGPGGSAGAQPLFGAGGPSSGAGGARAGGPPGFAGGASGAGRPTGPPGVAGAGGPGGSGGPGGAGGGAVGAPLGNSASISAAISYATAHGGGTIAVSSQSSAAQPIIDQDANVAGIGGFSGRESDVSISWLAQEVRDGKIRWVLVEQGGGSGGGPRLAGDSRQGSKAAMAAVAKVCTAASISTSSATGTSGSGRASAEGTLYDCEGHAAALLAAGA